MEATRKIDHSKTCIDHFIVQNIPKHDLQVLEHQNSSYDSPVVLKREYNKNFTKKRRFKDVAFSNHPAKVKLYEKNRLK